MRVFLRAIILVQQKTAFKIAYKFEFRIVIRVYKIYLFSLFFAVPIRHAMVTTHCFQIFKNRRRIKRFSRDRHMVRNGAKKKKEQAKSFIECYSQFCYV